MGRAPARFFGYGVILDRQIFGGAIPFSTTPILIALVADSYLVVGRSGLWLNRSFQFAGW
jgi:hypothetical protein